MLNITTFGEKLKSHRTHRNLTQQAVADKIGVSAQAVSKWENGECLPDCFNLKQLGDLYEISLDVLMETEESGNISVVSAKIEQIADEFIWSKRNRDLPNAHRDLGSDLWQMWKGIFFVEIGDKDRQKLDKASGNLRVNSNYGVKIWDDDGIACVVQSSLRDKLGDVGEHELELLCLMASSDCFKLLTLLDCTTPTSKDRLLEMSSISEERLNLLLIKLLENQIIEFVVGSGNVCGYKICGHFGISAYMMLAAAHILSKKSYTLSEYLTNESYWS